MSDPSCHSSDPARPSRHAFALVTIAVGLLAGVGGLLLAWLLRLTQHLAYGYDLTTLRGEHSFAEGVAAASDLRRFVVLIGCGLVAGSGWWLLHRYGQPRVPIEKALAVDDTTSPRFPTGTTLIHAMLQSITVGLGSPLGREVAPREVGALLASGLARRARLAASDARLVVACGAGAGLAAVYNVPLAGALFVLEGLVATVNWRAALAALLSSALAAFIASLGLGGEAQYAVPHFQVGVDLLVWSALSGPLFGLAAFGFVRLTRRARAKAPADWKLPVLALLNFTCIGALAVVFPELLGNGKSVAQLGFESDLNIAMAAVLLILRVLITVSTLRAGAYGGVLTPALAIGALLAVVLGGGWTMLWPGVPPGAFALIGAAAFLASSMRMPLTALVLVAELTRLEHGMLLPMILAVVGSAATHHAIERWQTRRRDRDKTPTMPPVSQQSVTEP